MNKKSITKWMLAAGILLTGVPFVESCSTDDNIDLGELDKTIGIGSDSFTLPSSSSRETPLGDLLEFDEGSVVDTLKKDSGDYKRGDYQFMKGDTIKWATPKVKEVKFSDKTSTDYGFNVEIQDELVTAVKAALAAGTTIPEETRSLPEEDINIFSYSGKGDKAVLKLTSAKCSNVIELDLNFSELAKCIKKADFDVIFPDFFNVSILTNKCTGFSTSEKIEFGNGILKLTDVILANKKTIVLQIDDLINFVQTPSDDKKDNYLALNKNQVSINGHVKMRGSYNTKDINMEDITAGTKKVVTEVKFSDEIVVTEATGYFDPDIVLNPSNVTIKDVPSFLDDTEVNLSVHNPSIKFEVVNNIGADAIVEGLLTARYKDGTKKRLSVKGITMEKGSMNKPVTTTIVLCRYTPTSKTAGTKYILLSGTKETKANDTIVVEDIAKVLQQIPENLEFKFDARVDTTKEASIELYAEGTENDKNARGCGYTIKPKYNFTAPLELEPGSIIMYKDTIDDMNKDITENDIDFYGKDSNIFIEADVKNDSPLDLVIMNPKPIGVKPAGATKAPEISTTKVSITDSNGNEKDQVTINENGKLYLKASGSIKDFDGIIFEVKAVSKRTETLNASNHKIKIQNMKIHLNGKVTIDLED